MEQLLLLCVLFLSFSPLHASVIENTCKLVTNNKERYNFCVTSFQASPKSRSADIYGLSVIGLELALANHSYNLDKAKQLQEQSGLPPKTKECIDFCFQVYMSSTSALNDAIESAVDELPFTAEIAGAASAAVNCHKQFKEAGQKDLLATENYNAFTLDYIMGGLDILLHRRPAMN